MQKTHKNHSMSLFYFKQFSISHDFGMKIGTDAVLLGAWTPIKNVQTALDLGTGTGIIALMLAQRGTPKIVGIDIDTPSVEEAKHNVKCSPWHEKIDIRQGDFCNKTFIRQLGTFDLIVSNPPFFIHSMKSPFGNRNTARHSESLPFEVLIHHALQILNPAGKLCVILPYHEATIFTKLAVAQNLFPETICNIRPYPTASPNRQMIAFQKKSVTPIYETLCIRNENRSYSDEYKSFTKDFYLNLEEQQRQTL